MELSVYGTRIAFTLNIHTSADVDTSLMLRSNSISFDLKLVASIMLILRPQKT